MDKVAVTLLSGFAAAVNGEPVPPTAWRLRRGRELVKLLALAPVHWMPASWPMSRSDDEPMRMPRLAATIALVLGLLTLAAAAFAVITNFAGGLILALLLIAAAVAAGMVFCGLVSRGSCALAWRGQRRWRRWCG